MRPARIQRRRTKGWDMQKASPNGLPVVYVGRPTPFGNPYSVRGWGRQGAFTAYRLLMVAPQADIALIRRELKGKNLCCWCPLDQPCHADILLEIANSC
jgi:Domain of unknown function (DUF4326)